MLDKIARMLKNVCLVLGLEVRKADPAELRKYLWLEYRKISTIVDIGAHTGEFALIIHKVLPNAAIHSFEPLHDCYKQLVGNTKHISQIKAYNVAVGDVDGNTIMYRNEFTPSSSLLPVGDLLTHAFPYAARTTQENIEVKKLDSIAGSIDCSGNVLVKIDVQGYEDKVVAGGKQFLSTTKVLIIETSFKKLYEGQMLFGDIYDILTNIGFTYMGCLDRLRNPIDGSILQEDSIFMRENAT